MNEGWAGAHKTRDQSSDYASNFKTEVDAKYVIRFLDDRPYASYRQHWLERSGKRSFVCPEDPDDDTTPRCPLCDAGDKARAQYAFNVVVLDEDQKPTIKSWDVGIKLFQKFERTHKDERIGPLNDPYFEVCRTGKGGTSDTALVPIKERDLFADYGIEPFTEREFEALQAKGYDKSIVDAPGISQLKELAKELLRYDDRS